MATTEYDLRHAHRGQYSDRLRGIAKQLDAVREMIEGLASIPDSTEGLTAQELVKIDQDVRFGERWEQMKTALEEVQGAVQDIPKHVRVRQLLEAQPRPKVPKGLKVYGWIGFPFKSIPRTPDPDHPWRRQVRLVIAAKSMAECARAAGERSPRNLSNLGETGNVQEIETALTKPGTIFWQPIDARQDSSYLPVEEK